MDKRKVDFITLDNGEPNAQGNKKFKSDTDYPDQTIITINADDDNDVVEILENENDLNNEFINQYIDTLKKCFSKFNGKTEKSDSLIGQLKSTVDKVKSTNVKFIEQSQFKNLFTTFTADLYTAKNIRMVTEFHNDLIKELYRFTVICPPSTSNDAKIHAQIKRYTKNLMKIQKTIDKTENQELDLDDLEHPNSFTILPRLYHLALYYWKKREKLLNRSTNTGLNLYGKFNCKYFDNDSINKIIENFFKKSLQTLVCIEDYKTLPFKERKNLKKKKDFLFTIIDLRNELTKEITAQKINFQLTDSILEDIYRKLLTEMKKRRMATQFESLRSIEYLKYSSSDSIPDETNPEIIKKLNENEIEGIKNLEKIMDDYKKQDYELNGNQNENDCKTIGWDDGIDNDNEGEDDDEDDDDDDEDDEEEETNEIFDENDDSSDDN